MCNFMFLYQKHKIYLWFGLVYLFIYSVTYVTLDMSITDYNLQHNLQYMDIHTMNGNGLFYLPQSVFS